MNTTPHICSNCIHYCKSGFCRHPNSIKTDEQVSEDYSCVDIELIIPKTIVYITTEKHYNNRLVTTKSIEVKNIYENNNIQ